MTKFETLCLMSSILMAGTTKTDDAMKQALRLYEGLKKYVDNESSYHQQSVSVDYLAHHGS